MVNLYTLRRCSDKEIIKEIEKVTGLTVTDRYIRQVRQKIKKESYDWYKGMREGQYEYIHEFKERIDEILSLQKKHHQIIDSNEDNPSVQQTSLAELHRLNITLSNYFDVAPDIINGSTISETPKAKASTAATEIIV